MQFSHSGLAVYTFEQTSLHCWVLQQRNIVLHWQSYGLTFTFCFNGWNRKVIWTVYISRYCRSVSCWAPLIFNLLKHRVIIAVKTTVPIFSLMISLIFIDNKHRLSLCRFPCPLCPSQRVQALDRWAECMCMTTSKNPLLYTQAQTHCSVCLHCRPLLSSPAPHHREPSSCQHKHFRVNKWIPNGSNLQKRHKAMKNGTLTQHA